VAAPPVWWGVPLGVALAIVGSVGTWESSELAVFGQSESTGEGGIGEGGEFVIVFTVAAAVLLALWRDGRRTWQALGAAAGAGAALVVCVLSIADVDDAQLSSLGQVSVGWGLWLALIGSIVLTLVALALALRHGRSP
jgi:hypothetical protein